MVYCWITIIIDFFSLVTAIIYFNIHTYCNIRLQNTFRLHYSNDFFIFTKINIKNIILRKIKTAAFNCLVASNSNNFSFKLSTLILVCMYVCTYLCFVVCGSSCSTNYLHILFVNITTCI